MSLIRTPMAVAIQLVFISSALLAGAGNVQAQAAPPPAAAPASHDFHVPPGELGEALRQVASQAGVLLSFTPEQTRGKTSSGLDGRHTVADALNGVLRGTGLTAALSANGAWVLRAAEAPTIGSLPAVSVTAQGDASEGTGAYVSTAALGTATPLGLSLRETPQSISVITSARMADQGLTTIGQVMAQAPGVTLFSLGSERTGLLRAVTRSPTTSSTASTPTRKTWASMPCLRKAWPTWRCTTASKSCAAPRA